MSDGDTRASSISSRIAAFASDLSLADIPVEVVERARHLFLDALGCALGARNEEFARIYADAVVDLSGTASPGSGRAVIGHSLRLPMRDAALLNGVLAHGLDFDDTHIAGIAHLSVSVMPAILALGAERSIGGNRALLAYILGLEAGSRISAAAPGVFHDRGFHPTAMVGVFASAIASAALIGLDVKSIERAQGFALSVACGTLQFVEDGAWTKRMHAGWAASAGISCAIMARHPIPTPESAYEGRFGLYRAFLGEQMRGVDVAAVADNLGSTWSLMQIGVKPFPVCHFNHACAEAAVVLHQRLARAGVGVERIRSIQARVPEGVMPSVCVPLDKKRRPTTEYEAKFSIPYAVAAGLLRGRLGLADLAPEAIADARAHEMMQRIECVADPASTFPRHYTGEVVITLDDGSTDSHRITINSGHPERPLEVDAIRSKYRHNAATCLKDAEARDIEDFILNLQMQKDMRMLEPLIAPSSSAARPKAGAARP